MTRGALTLFQHPSKNKLSIEPFHVVCYCRESLMLWRKEIFTKFINCIVAFTDKFSAIEVLCYSKMFQLFDLSQKSEEYKFFVALLRRFFLKVAHMAFGDSLLAAGASLFLTSMLTFRADFS
ncbi:hypothetical protein TNCV_111201 [Trichonephila clavipes]|nr:hypothetical protein TNCV_111201 [Trichonephila clavipes]